MISGNKQSIIINYQFIYILTYKSWMSKENPLQLNSLAQQPQLLDYQNKPIENYGMSLLKNMGFNENKGIGKRNKSQPTQILVLKPRPKGLGLGAQTQQQKPKQEFQAGDRVQIIQQPHKQLVGIILEVNQSNVLIQLHPSHSSIKVSKQGIKKISKKEMKALLEQLYTEKQKKRKRLKWIVPQIRIKITDKYSQNYLQKMIVTQIISDKQFECRDEKGKVYTSFTQKDVQTIVPKPGGKIMILKGNNIGQTGTLLQRKKGKNRVTVQTTQQLQILKLQEDDVAQYISL